MKANKRGSIKAKELLEEIGFVDISDLPMDLLVSGLCARAAIPRFPCQMIFRWCRS